MHRDQFFSVSPLSLYRRPRYASESGEHAISWACRAMRMFGASAGRLAAVVLIAAGLALGAGGCLSAGGDDPGTTNTSSVDASTEDMIMTDDGTSTASTDETNTNNDEYDISDGFEVSCNPNDIYCSTDTYIIACIDDGYYPSQRELTCDEFCAATYGQGFASVGGCDAQNPDNLCNCRNSESATDGDDGEYGTLEGDTAEVNESDLDLEPETSEAGGGEED